MKRKQQPSEKIIIKHVYKDEREKEREKGVENGEKMRETDAR